VQKPGKLGFKPQRSRPICKGFSMVEGYTYGTKNPRGLKAKAQCTEGLTGTLPVDPVARIDLGRRIRIGQLRLAAALQRRHRRRRTAASGGGIAGETQSRVSGHESRRDLVLNAELDAMNSTNVSMRAEGRRRQRAMRRGGRRHGCDSGELLSAVLGRGTSTSCTSGLLTSCSCSRSKPRRRGGGVGEDRQRCGDARVRA
jgi:hypothetical protein